MANNLSMASLLVDTDGATNWQECCLCQKPNSGKLTDPSGGGYVTLATNIPQFYNLNCMPIPFDPKRLDEGCGILKTLQCNKAVYHETCRLKFNNSKLNRKRKSPDVEEDNDESCSVKFTRSNTSKQDSAQSIRECFICDEKEPIKELRQCTSSSLHQIVKRCATNLLDDKLLVKLSSGDIVAQRYMYHRTCLSNLYNRERGWLRSKKPVMNHNIKQKHKQMHLVN